MPAGFDPLHAQITHRRRLPHMRQPQAIYFVTFRTADSAPAEKIRLWHAEANEFTTEEGSDKSRNHAARQLERWLDRGEGACPFQNAAAAKIIERALLFFDGDRYLLDEYVIMPNHVHALLSPLADHSLSAILHSWKSYSAKQVNALLGRTGQLWQAESFDHIVRDTAALHRFRTYIRSNPSKLPGRQYLAGHGSFTQVIGV